ncbi:MAG: hypothetical protein ACKO9W_07230, partial [Bacteroidota bacterium]
MNTVQSGFQYQFQQLQRGLIQFGYKITGQAGVIHADPAVHRSGKGFPVIYVGLEDQSVILGYKSGLDRELTQVYPLQLN